MLQDKEIVTVEVLDTNQGGLITRCQSLQAFIPISQLNRPSSSWLSQEVRCSARLVIARRVIALSKRQAITVACHQ